MPLGGGNATRIFAVNPGITLELSNITVSGGSAAFGGAINNSGTLEITSSTFSGNSADSGGGAILNFGAVIIAASIVADNTALTVPNCLISTGSVTSLSSNLSNDASCPFTAVGDIQNSASINLGLLADNGGPTLTRLPQANSDAIDNAVCLTSEDQRGQPRPSGAGCDIGSVEVQQSTYALCVSRYTGAVSSPLPGGCGAGRIQLDPAG